ncbi:MAG TPA: type I methionyl aminopeptidase [Clostridiales bacterium]|nr:type I methionyl aminopeptidase [Clostridiales bacterium]
MVLLKTLAEIGMMAEAGHIVAEVLELMGKIIAPGISTLDLDREARAIISRAGATPSFLGYGQPPFPGAICASIDAEVVHGIPSRQRILKEGSLISIDVGACLNGYHADAARTFAVGEIKPAAADLIRVTEECFWKGFAQAIPGARLGDISAAVQQHAEAHGYGVVRELTGHGTGRSLHEDPDLPNFGRAGHGMRLEPGLVVALEPMINLGTRRVYIQEDEWTIVTADGQPSAHYENTLAILADGPVILTRL